MAKEFRSLHRDRVNEHILGAVQRWNDHRSQITSLPARDIARHKKNADEIASVLMVRESAQTVAAE